ncbi:MAG: DUF4921 family protein [bacterium]|nr:DUF4921 family protein [bacterium]
MSQTPLNEFRKDPISGDWVLFAAGRSKRPGGEGKDNVVLSGGQEVKACPFDDPVAMGQEIVKEYNNANGEKWVTVIKNKYPAVTPGACGPQIQIGPFSAAAANGFHEVVITNNHERTFPDFDLEETRLVLQAFQERYQEISKYECGDYIQIFNNTGKDAGASIAHPHSQILSTPIVPPLVARSLNGAAGYFLKHQQTAHKSLLDWEIEQGKRVIFKNEHFVAYCPFVSHKPYEIKILPRQQNAKFETSSAEELTGCAEALNFSLRQLNKVFNHKLAFNFFIHTAPVKEENLFPFPSDTFYHWHIEIVPHLSILAGFDFSTGIIVNVIDPDQAAEELRTA